MSELSFSCGPQKPLLDLTLADALARTAQRYPGREALVSRHQDLRYTWAEFDEAVTRVARGLSGLGLRHQGNPARVFNLLSDGELDEGSTWEAAMACAHHGLDNVTAIVDVNALQADGPTVGVLRTEPVQEKWQAFGWNALRVDGNDIAALVAAFDRIAEHRGSPSVLICDTRIGNGVPLLMEREKAHFMRVEEHEWQIARTQLEEGSTR